MNSNQMPKKDILSNFENVKIDKIIKSSLPFKYKEEEDIIELTEEEDDDLDEKLEKHKKIQKPKEKDRLSAYLELISIIAPCNKDLYYSKNSIIDYEIYKQYINVYNLNEQKNNSKNVTTRRGRGKGKKINQSQKISNSSNNNEANNKNEDKTEDNIKINPIKEIDDLVSKIIKGKKKIEI